MFFDCFIPFVSVVKVPPSSHLTNITSAGYLESKLKGSTYFPTSLSGIYNATMIIQQRHFPVCPCVSSEALGMYNQLKTLTARSASTKEYWVSSAMKMVSNRTCLIL